MVYGSRFTVYANELRGGFFITVNRHLTTINTEIGAIWLNSDETMIKAAVVNPLPGVTKKEDGRPF